MISVALVGNPNTGKTTVFNALTGSKQYVGNWPGVTIDKKYGFINKDIKVCNGHIFKRRKSIKKLFRK